MPRGKEKRIPRKLKWDRNAALEGLPLYLIILVIITAVAIVAILSWMPSGGMLDKIVVTNDGTFDDTDTNFEGFVYDTEGNPLEGVSILAEGPNNAVGASVSDGSGHWNIQLNKEPTLIQNTNSGQITFEASYESITKTTLVVIVDG